MNLLETVERLQQTLSDAAKASLDRRFGALFDKVYRKDVLWDAWRRVRANKGGPGVDGETIEYIEDEIGVGAFLRELRDELKSGCYRPQPVKRSWIDKPGRSEKRPLGIPVVRDRVAQTATKLVLEPIFETNFDQDSYGFRPGKSAQEAISEIQRSITFQRYREVVDIDLKSYFDTIDHSIMMKLVGRRVSDPRVLRLIRMWLKAGVMEEGKLRKQLTGTPQGGCISPLLSNVYLHSFDKMWRLRGIRGTKLIRYADDMVLLCRGGGRHVLRRVREFLSRLRLTVNEEKTRVVAAAQGFDFLGMTFRFQKVSRRATKLTHSCYRWPRAKAVASLREKIRQRIGRRYSLSLKEVINEINPILRGWHNYFRRSNGERTFRDLDQFVLDRLRIFVKRKHSDESRGTRRLAGDRLDRLGLYRLSQSRFSGSA
jgi:group II intron reverse transcriptase/maturase